ncbi:NAD(P)-dependent dehydrogenase (short-subunit alcohol dehydrogenase family) [Maribacter spongiicola]|uniref:NAD(P)-dependent dehydrogenase (Short-subunit alcohol dehydrogenase family) n=1 Tax=Maribacter spongiicola TaxID=1206753 RepID=A0A4R7K2F3_9FLAO|nr:SDR family oxidoreductase [Maribacter spongiicola]TDT43719.1 NAD(P)-dependent dehydrogenase (short-subunit alcohol dehydrogenase family) [Maribacter spongiicola]
MENITIDKNQEQAKQPGKEFKMNPEPLTIRKNYKGSDKLKSKVVLLTGGDSGIGKSVAVHFAREGAMVSIIYLNEEKDALKTKSEVENEGGQCLLIKGDVKDEQFCKKAIDETISKFGFLNCIVNNAAMQFPTEHIEDIKTENLHTTFETNIYPYFYIVKAAMKHLKEGDTIINTTSVTAYRGSEHLIDYASTKGAIVSFTRSLSKSLAKKGIRVNAVAPGPIWTPLIPATFEGEDLEKFGKDVPMGRAGQPAEVGPAYVYLASEDSSYMTGQVLHINGGEVIGG